MKKNIWRFEEELFSRFTVSVCRESLSVCECFFSFGFENRIWELVVLVPSYCVSLNFTHTPKGKLVSLDMFMISLVVLKPVDANSQPIRTKS